MRIKCIENQQNIDKCHSEPACRFTCPRHGRQGSMTKESQKANRTNHHCDADLKASVEGISKKEKAQPKTSLRGTKQSHKKVTHPTIRLLHSYLTRNDHTLVFRHSESSEGISKRKNTSQTATSVRVFYSKHENKMYREPTKYRQMSFRACLSVHLP